ncbi:hypothetical protein QLH51_15200 [Sphingomonas sp. 2R-10]|uniref:hypothetical protein n=1 Tax=Sphingomonas sp. 2R-10 TaxID=3045148 RepID=UPI000F777975|nr:hypothetical protein [Sphingomonas sp. 2R-10]MDJ0278144.1 hypothetical protein [Sphingomonas sp. 2R-10]
MNSPSVVSRLAAFEIPATLAVGIAGWLLSRLLRNEFAAPPGQTWLWVCSATALAVAYYIAGKRGLSPLSWMSHFTITYLLLQIIVQTGFAYGIIAF